MNNKFLGKFLSQAFAWASVIALSSAIALAQDAAPASTQRTDGQIEMDVVHALDASNALKQDLITAATIQSEVTLSGTVSNEASKELAEAIAGRVAGVTKVNDNLKVGNPQDAQAAQDAAQPAPAPDPAPAADNAQPQSASGPAPDPGSAPYPAQAQAPAASPDAAPSMQANNTPPPPPPPPGARPEYGAVRPRMQKYADPSGPVTVAQGTLLRLRTSEFVDSKRAKDGTPVQFTVIEDIASGGVLAIPRGATVHGVVTEVKQAGALAGSSELALKLTSLDLGGQSYPLETDQFKVKAPNKAGQTVGSAIGGGIIGTIIGCAAGRGAGCAIGAGAGVAAGTAASAASPGARAWIPAEAQVDFHLSAPLTVTPVDKQEAARLAQGLYPGGPNLYRRGYYGPYGSPYPYPYAYAPVYYRPYYVVGGYYYWR
jgi:hypothetical protein